MSRSNTIIIFITLSIIPQIIIKIKHKSVTCTCQWTLENGHKKLIVDKTNDFMSKMQISLPEFNQLITYENLIDDTQVMTNTYGGLRA